LAPCRLNRQINATMSPSDAAIRPRRRLWLPARGCLVPKNQAPDRASQVPGGSVRARCLLSPRGVRSVHLIEASRSVLASPYPAGWPLPVSRNEAEPSSQDTTARALAFPSVNGQDRSHPLKGWLHDSRPFIMVNTFQFTRTTKLAWRFPDGRGWARMGEELEPFRPFIRVHPRNPRCPRPGQSASRGRLRKETPRGASVRGCEGVKSYYWQLLGVSQRADDGLRATDHGTTGLRTTGLKRRGRRAEEGTGLRLRVRLSSRGQPIEGGAA